MKAIFCAVLLFLCLTASAGGAEFTGITMGLGSTSWNTQLPAAVAQQAGFFKEQGLDVRAVTIASGGPVMMALLSSGEAQVIIAGAVAILRGIASGAPAVIIGGEMDKPDYVLIGAKGLKTVADLKGKVVGSTGAGTFSARSVNVSYPYQFVVLSGFAPLVGGGAFGSINLTAAAVMRLESAAAP